MKKGGISMNYRDTARRNKYYHCLEYDHQQEGELCLVACGMEHCDPGVTFGPDLRECWHLHAVLAGTGTLQAGGEELHPGPGQLFLLKDNQVAQYTADPKDPWNYCWVTFTGTKASQLVREIGFTEGVYVLDASVEIRRFFELVHRMHETPEMNYISDLRRRGILLEFLSLALLATESGQKRAERRNEYSPEVYVQRSVDFIHYNYATINVTDIVEYIGFTRSYFSTLFRRHMGISPQEYLMRYRMEQACRLLRDTALSVQEIGERVGYEEPLNFSRSFKRSVGLSPTEYRKRTSQAPPSERKTFL
jgi:AraC family transcriptional regulator of arabinose operon